MTIIAGGHGDGVGACEAFLLAGIIGAIIVMLSRDDQSETKRSSRGSTGTASNPSYSEAEFTLVDTQLPLDTAHQLVSQDGPLSTTPVNQLDDNQRALGTDTEFIAMFVASLALRILLGDSEGNDHLLPLFSDACHFSIGIRAGFVFEGLPEDVVRVISCVRTPQVPSF